MIFPIELGLFIFTTLQKGFKNWFDLKEKLASSSLENYVLAEFFEDNSALNYLNKRSLIGV